MGRKATKILHKYFGPRETIRRFVKVAEEDTDAISIYHLAPDHVRRLDDVVECDGALVVIKGGREVALFRQWAVRTGLMTPGKPISAFDGFEREHLPGVSRVEVAEVDAGEAAAATRRRGRGDG